MEDKNIDELQRHNNSDNEAISHAQVKVLQQVISGPIPAPQVLKGYDDVYPGAAKIILEDFQKNSSHIREKEREQLRAEISRDRRGQWMAFTIMLLVFGITGLSLYLGNVTFAGVSGLCFVGVVASSFMSGNRKQKK